MNARASMLRDIRQALGRSSNSPVPEPPPVRLRSAPVPDRLALFTLRLETLLGTVHPVRDYREAGAEVTRLVAGRSAVASGSPLLLKCGIEADRTVLPSHEVGITGAEYGLAATGTLVMLSSATEARANSLLPPVHIAVLEASRILADIEELFTVLPEPARQTSSMVLITGPSRTGDIEQISIRGVHGPGQVHVVLITEQ